MPQLRRELASINTSLVQGLCLPWLSSSRDVPVRPWIAVFVLPEKINVFKHGGDREQSRLQASKNVHNVLITVRKIS